MSLLLSWSPSSRNTWIMTSWSQSLDLWNKTCLFSVTSALLLTMAVRSTPRCSHRVWKHQNGKSTTSLSDGTWFLPHRRGSLSSNILHLRVWSAPRQLATCTELATSRGLWPLLNLSFKNHCHEKQPFYNEDYISFKNISFWLEKATICTVVAALF